MAKVSGPLLSMRSSGTIGKTLVFGSWRGIGYARGHVVPSNPRTSGQVSTRQALTFCTGLWKLMTSTAIGPWNTYATGQRFTGFNAFQSFNIPMLREATSLADLIGSPGAKSGPAAASMTFATGAASGEVKVDYTAPSSPTGWTLVSIQALVTTELDPSTDLPSFATSGEQAAPTLTLTVGSLTPGEDYAMSAWLKWTTDQGKTAYSVSQTDIVTAHA